MSKTPVLIIVGICNVRKSIKTKQMSRLKIASNQLPFMIDKSENQLILSSGAGGLATGLKSHHKGS